MSPTNHRFIRVTLISVLLAAASLSTGDGPATRPGTDNLYVLVGYGGRRISTRDGVHWENDQEFVAKGGDDEYLLCDIAYGDGRFIAVGGGIWLTRDGKDWRKVADPRGRTSTIAYGDGAFVATHGEGFLVSTDGEKWDEGAKVKFEGGIHFRRCAFGNHRFVFLADCDPVGGKRIPARAATPDGRSVTYFQPDTPSAHGIAFGAGRFVVVGEGGLRESSTDGQHWEHRATEPGEDFWEIVWDGSQFIVGGGPHAYTSPDGITWTKHETRLPCSPFAGTAGGPYVGGSWGGSLWHSDDGLAWVKSDSSKTNALAAGAVATNPKPER